MNKATLPENIAKEMKMWRAGFGMMPTSYIKWHRDLAKARLEGLKAEGVSVISTEMKSDGWFDGMRVLVAEVETASGKALTIKWHDGNQGFLGRTEDQSGWSSVSSWA